MIRFFKDLISLSAREELSAKANAHAVPVAALALMITIARADHAVEETELETILNEGRKLFELSTTEASQLLDLAHSDAESSTSLYEFTDLINNHFSSEQKYSLIRAMWRVAFADGKLDRYEEHFIRKVADLIYVPHLEFIQAKHEVMPS